MDVSLVTTDPIVGGVSFGYNRLGRVCTFEHVCSYFPRQAIPMFFVRVPVNSQVNWGPTIRFNCPSCKTQSTWAWSYEQRDEIPLAKNDPLFTSHHTFLKCSTCHGEAICRVPLSELTEYTPEELSHHISVRVLLYGIVLAFACFVMCFVPVVGVGVAIAGIMVNAKAPLWLKIVNWVGMACCVLTTLGFVAIFVWEVIKK